MENYRHNNIEQQGEQEVDYSRFEFPAASVVDFFNLLSTHKIPAWLDGGWGVDAMAQRQTRPHRDIDIVVPSFAGDEMLKLLSDANFSLDPNETRLPHRLVMLDTFRLLMIDIHFVEFQPDGSAIWTIPSYSDAESEYKYEYTAEGFGGVGTIDGTPIPCLTLEEQVRCRTTRGYSFSDPDRQRANGVNADLHDLGIIKSIIED